MKYFVYSSLYGLARAAYYVPKFESSEYSPMRWSDKLVAVVVGSCVTSVSLPFVLIDDLDELEARIKKIQSKKYITPYYATLDSKRYMKQ